MTSRRQSPRIRWCSRTVAPPGNVVALRRAVGLQPWGAILESVGEAATAGRYSTYVIDGVRVCRGDLDSALACSNPDGASVDIDPFEQLASVCRPWVRYEERPDVPFPGGWVGYLAYEAGRFTEPTAGWPGGEPREREPRLPVSYWVLYDTVLVHDVVGGEWRVAGVELPEGLGGGSRKPLDERLDAMERFLLSVGDVPSGAEAGEGCAGAAGPRQGSLGDPTCGEWNFGREAYLEKVRRSLAYIEAGDIFQVNITRRLAVGTWAHPACVYQALCEANPAAYAAYVPVRHGQEGEAGSEGAGCQSDGTLLGAVVSSSPELYLALREGIVTTRPIKGTRPRGATPEADVRERQALMQSEKDRAELNMIVDLERNDLGRVCEFGTVRVLHEGELEEHPTVYHRTATIEGRLRPECDAIDLLRATFPGGSITGAPKVRAMQIIQELEPTPRGPYCGAVGWIGLDGDMQLNLPIRTLWMVRRGEPSPGPSLEGRGETRMASPGGRGDTRRPSPGPSLGGRGVDGDDASYVVMLQVGSGIVADSDPEDEYAELEAKAAGMMSALRQTLGAYQYEGVV